MAVDARRRRGTRARVDTGQETEGVGVADVEPFRVELALVSGAVVVRVFGELDYFSSPDVKDSVFGVVDGGRLASPST